MVIRFGNPEETARNIKVLFLMSILKIRTLEIFFESVESFFPQFVVVF